MNPHQDDVIYKRNLGFFGAIIASQSHEINNVITTINEVAGLSHDLLLDADEDNPPPNLARHRELLEKIAAQVARGRDVITGLNRFAHSVDDHWMQLDVKENLLEITGLCQRFARMKRIDCHIQTPEKPIRLKGSPFDLQHVIYRTIEIGVSNTHQGDTITLAVQPLDGEIRLDLTGQSAYGAPEDLPSMLSFLSLLVTHLGGRVESKLAEDEPIRLRVYLSERLGSCGE